MRHRARAGWTLPLRQAAACESGAAEIDPKSPRDPGYRMPRITAELVSARPIDIAFIDGIETVSGGEGPWIRGLRYIRPGVLLLGTNGVTTDAVATAVMGYDPLADKGNAPFKECDNTLKLAEGLGIGSADLKKIEVRGLSIAEGPFPIFELSRPSCRGDFGGAQRA